MTSVMSFPPIVGADGGGAVPRPPSASKASKDPNAVAALQAEIAEMERLEQRMAAKRRPAPPQAAKGSSAAESAEFQRLLLEVRSETKDTLAAMESARTQKGDLEQRVLDLAKQLKDVTHEEMSLVDRQEVMVKENVELKAALGKCEEELAVQRALNDEELGMVDELASMQDERDHLRVEVATMRESVDPLNLMVVALEDDKSKLQDAKQKLEDRVRRQAAQLGGGEEMLNQAQSQIEELTIETAQKLAALEKRRADFEAQLIETRGILVPTQADLKQTQETLATEVADAAWAKEEATSAIANLTAINGELTANLAQEKLTCEEQIGIARSDRAIIVKELRRVQEKEAETQKVGRIQESSEAEAIVKMQEAQSIATAARAAEADASEKLQAQIDRADTQQTRADECIVDMADMKAFTDEQNALAAQTMEESGAALEIMQRKVDACSENIRQGQDIADALVADAEKRCADATVNAEQKSADCDSLHQTIDALKQDSAKAWEDLVSTHERQVQKEREAAIARLSAELAKQDDQLGKFWQRRLDEEVELHQRTAAVLAELRVQFAEAEKRLQEQAAVCNSLQSGLDATEKALKQSESTCEELQTTNDGLSDLDKQKTAELDAANDKVAGLDDSVARKDMTISSLEEGRERLQEEVKYIEGKVVAARTDKLDAIADIQVRNVLLEKELVVKTEKAKLDGEEAERLQRDRGRQGQRLTEAGR